MQVNAKHISSRISRKRRLGLVIAAGAALAPFGSAKGAFLVNLAIEGNTTGSSNYASTLSGPLAAGTTLYFEVVATAATTGTTNANTGTKTPNGTTDTLIAVPNFTLTNGSNLSFATSVLQNNFSTGSGASNGTGNPSGAVSGTTPLQIRAIEVGFSENEDTPLQVLTGSLVVGSSFLGTALSATTIIPLPNTGSMKFGSTVIPISNTTESSADPIVGFSPLVVVSTPEPASCGLLLLGAPALLARRRRRA
jgi:hypothetical protein